MAARCACRSVGRELSFCATDSDCATVTVESSLRVSSRGRTSGLPGNTTPDHGGHRPCWIHHRQPDSKSRVGEMCLPRWVSPRGHATRSHRRSVFRRAPGRQRRPSTPTPGVEPGSRPRQGRMFAAFHHVGFAVAPAGIEPATSGSKVRCPSPAETPGLDGAAAIATGIWIGDIRSLSAHGTRSRPSRCERKPDCHEPHHPHLLGAVR